MFASHNVPSIGGANIVAPAPVVVQDFKLIEANKAAIQKAFDDAAKAAAAEAAEAARLAKMAGDARVKRYSDLYPPSAFMAEPDSSDPYGATLSAVMGDPSHFKADFVDCGRKWGIFNDTRGRPWQILLDGYKFPYLQKRGKVVDNRPAQGLGEGTHLVTGYEEALEWFHKAEKENAAAQGFSVDPTWVAAQLPDAKAYSLLTPGEKFYRTPDTERAWHVIHFPIVVEGNQAAAYENQAFHGGNQVGSTLFAATDGKDLGPLLASPNIADVCRAQIAIEVEYAHHKYFTVYATVNTRLRIGYLTGFAGTVSGGSDWLSEALHTLENIGKIIIGIVTGNVSMIVGAFADIIKTWYAYSQKHSRDAAIAEAEGRAIKARGKGGIGPQPDTDPVGPRLLTLEELSQQQKRLAPPRLAPPASSAGVSPAFALGAILVLWLVL